MRRCGELFKKGWYSQELKGYRDTEHHSTYHFFEMDSLPPLPEGFFQGTFSWLSEQNIVSADQYSELEFTLTKMNSLIQQAEQMSFALPPEFVTFFSSSLLPGKIRSCTDCCFALSSRIQPCAGDLGGWVIPVLYDSQGVLFWNLYIGPDGDSCVVYSEEWYDVQPDDEDDEDDEIILAPPTAEDLLYCSPSFEAFVYRFWIENEIWFSLYQNVPLTDLQKKYVSHYRSE